ncbi:hypothetical protein G3578_04610 [Brevibacillus sp. SYP-B805]|uniref:hypothetical protein n=1 Tax=Brevibacillus sp. SYP-B805 TaxID=1578199 RepID=UPI0013EE3183|nr:hypothetical protein [Brevibacillus sp. SYP-B805]NGQ94459.1 hypothetical protein [Brevibacillus sp. SYP-B805]
MKTTPNHPLWQLVPSFYEPASGWFRRRVPPGCPGAKKGLTPKMPAGKLDEIRAAMVSCGQMKLCDPIAQKRVEFGHEERGKMT